MEDVLKDEFNKIENKQGKDFNKSKMIKELLIDSENKKLKKDLWICKNNLEEVMHDMMEKDNDKTDDDT